MGGGGGRLSNVILDPTLALIRAQLGFRIQVRAECGNKCKRSINEKWIDINLRSMQISKVACIMIINWSLNPFKYFLR